jgi:hypothetical protein
MFQRELYLGLLGTLSDYEEKEREIATFKGLGLGDVKVIMNPECMGWWWQEFAIWSLETLLNCEGRERNCSVLGFKVHGLGLGHV